MLRGATGAATPTLTSVLGALLIIGLLQNSINIQVAKAYYQIKEAPLIKLEKERGPRDLKVDESLRKKSIDIGLQNEQAQLHSDGEIWYTNRSNKGDQAGAKMYRRRGGEGIFIPLDAKP